VPLSPNSYIIWYRRWCSAAGKLTVGLASHRPCVTDFVVYSPTGSTATDREMSTPPMLRRGTAPFTFTFLLWYLEAWHSTACFLSLRLFDVTERLFVLSLPLPSLSEWRRYCVTRHLSVTLSHCCVYPPSHDCTRITVSVAKVMHCIQCSLVLVLCLLIYRNTQGFLWTWKTQGILCNLREKL